MAHRRLTTLVAAVLAVLCGMGLGGCTLPTGPSTPPPSGTPSPKPLPAHVADAKSRVASLAGVTHVEVSYSPDRFGYPSALTADVTAGAGADPIDILDRAYFELFKTAQTVDVFVVRQGQLWDGTHIGLAHVPAAADSRPGVISAAKAGFGCHHQVDAAAGAGAHGVLFITNSWKWKRRRAWQSTHPE